mmetsp:Transcript_16967/g.54317  ORF Transcript_16967/g.54317 Transcript_16967/m.54317 type:complete len:327 (+) Transcript_16967:53-1033(+)
MSEPFAGHRILATATMSVKRSTKTSLALSRRLHPSSRTRWAEPKLLLALPKTQRSKPLSRKKRNSSKGSLSMARRRPGQNSNFTIRGGGWKATRAPRRRPSSHPFTSSLTRSNARGGLLPKTRTSSKGAASAQEALPYSSSSSSAGTLGSVCPLRATKSCKSLASGRATLAALFRVFSQRSRRSCRCVRARLCASTRPAPAPPAADRRLNCTLAFSWAKLLGCGSKAATMWPATARSRVHVPMCAPASSTRSVPPMALARSRSASQSGHSPASRTLRSIKSKSLRVQIAKPRETVRLEPAGHRVPAGAAAWKPMISPASCSATAFQ